MSDQFRKDVLTGLKDRPKRLSSKYFYDAQGDYFFQKIMHSKEYYLPECELEIFSLFTDKIYTFIDASAPLNIIELGAGDGTKTAKYLKYLSEYQSQLKYIPFDISENVLEENAQNIRAYLPNIDINGISGDYFEKLDHLGHYSNKVILFLGSNIGNFGEELSFKFLKLVRAQMSTGDVLIVAADLKKDPRIVLPAYNDKEGWTAKFNYNLLERINRELQADFNEELFLHYQIYDPMSGECKSHLISLEEQVVHISEEEVLFKKNEPILMEISRKYDTLELEKWKDEHHFSQFMQLTDTKDFYSINLYKV